MKKIVITGGPTNEIIDEVMKITNMSTGSLSTALAGLFLKGGYRVHLIINRAVNTEKVEDISEAADNLTIDKVETTDDMMEALYRASLSKDTDALIHAAAVGDYRSDYTFLLDDLAKHLWKKISGGEIRSEKELLECMVNDKDEYYLDNSSKISSYQKNLTVKLTLTPKIISHIREWYPDTFLIGCKLLENVPKKELYDVACRLCTKNDMDFIMANDLADLRKGDKTRYVVDKNGFTGTGLETPKDIFSFIDKKLR